MFSMGRNKAGKPRKQRRSNLDRLDPLARSMSSCNADELWWLLFATASSPSARHRSASVGSALAAALRARSIAHTTLSSPLPSIQEIVDQAAEASGIDGAQEDFIPKDPSESLFVRVGDDLRHVVPGATERPIADLSRALRLAEALDPFLIRKHGFGLENVIRVAYNWAHTATNGLSSSFRPAPHLQLRDDIVLPVEEAEAAKALISQDPLTRFELKERDAAALEWMTTSSDNANFDSSSPNSPFGWYLRYRTPGQPDRWLPPTYVSEIVGAAVSELVATVHRNPEARRALRISSLDATRKALWRFSKSLYEGAPKLAGTAPMTGQEIQWILPVNTNTAIAVSMVQIEDLSPQTQSFECDRLAKRVSRSGEPVVVALAGGGELKLPGGTELVPLVTFAAAGHLAVPQRKGSATLALEDLTWIAETAKDEDDLYLFARDLSDPSFPENFGWEAINYWEPWRANGKSFFAGGITPSFFYFEAHAGDAEWERAAELSALEEALHATGLPPLRDTQVAEMTTQGVATLAIQQQDGSYDPLTGVHKAPPLLGWSLALTNPPVAITRSVPSWSPAEHYEFLFDFCGGLVFAFDATREKWEQVHSHSRMTGYRLVLQPFKSDTRSHSDQPIVEFTAIGERIFRWTIDVEKFVESVDGDPQAANRVTADAFVGLLESLDLHTDVVADIREDWLSKKPFLILETARSRTTLHHLPAAWGPDSSDEAATIAASARKLAASNVEPGTYRGHDANRLVQQHLAPLALAALTERIRAHDKQEILWAGLEQLNRVMDDGTRQREDLTRVAAHLHVAWDPQERMAEAMGNTLMLRQCNEIIVEAALRSTVADGPTLPITGRRWSGLLAAANAYRTMTTISERLHHKVAPFTIEITHAYEIKFAQDEQPAPGSWVLDVDALDKASAGVSLNLRKSSVTESPVSMVELDQAMLQAEGASVEDIFHVLSALVRWDSFSQGSSVGSVSENAVIDWICTEANDTTGARRERYSRALKLLVSTSEQLQESDWEPWQTRTRRHRLLVQPIVRSDTGSLLIAPQYLMTSLSVYDNHLSQGVLPWTDGIPPEVGKALARIRDLRNKHFEKKLDEDLRNLGFRTIARVKAGDHGRLGVPTLTTEVDLVAAKPGENTIWLIEAKDPASVHAVAETARQLRTFFRDSTNSRGKTKPSYSTQLARKEAELRPFIDQVAVKLGLEQLTDGSAYCLSTLFVTRRVAPAGFVNEKFPVLTLEEYLRPWLS
jgi:hypothetical protein